MRTGHVFVHHLIENAQSQAASHSEGIPFDCRMWVELLLVAPFKGLVAAIHEYVCVLRGCAASE